ncbi:MAG: hypothetical protein AB8F95_06140 [Bacteroidia bacterium]
MKKLHKLILASLSLLLLIQACKTEIDLYAPKEDIWVVYCILNLEDSVQYVRVSKAFQVEGDAFAYAGEQDLTVRNLTVQLSGPDGTLKAVPVDTLLREAGLFTATQQLYRLDTRGDFSLQQGVQYTLTVEADSLPGLFLEGKTRIPQAPNIQHPSSGIRNDSIACLSTWSLEDSLQIVFGTREPGSGPSGAMSFQIQATMPFQDNGEWKEAIFGPTKAFYGSSGCGSSNGDVRCYEISKEAVLFAFQNSLPQGGGPYTYAGDKRCAATESLLPEPVCLEILAIDTVLTKSMIANDPRYANYNTVRIEFTNMLGSERVVGVVGSVASAKRYLVLSRCAEWRLGLNAVRQRPRNCN